MVVMYWIVNLLIRGTEPEWPVKERIFSMISSEDLMSFIGFIIKNNMEYI